jgi:Protein of unknown function (DUF1549)/Protein of unknown function (DUF1553)
MCRFIRCAFTVWLVSGSACLAVDSSETASVSLQIDQLVEAGCKKDGVLLLTRCNDTDFLRRVWLDLAGRTPPLIEVKAVAAGSSLNRSEVVQRLLKSPEFARHWGRLWAEYLTDRRPFEADGYDGRRLLQFLTEAFRENQPYAELVSDLILGEGTSDVSGSVNFLLRFNAEPAPLTGAVSQKFLGLSLQCAECHDHPHARWKQKDFWGLAAHFARLRKMTPTQPEEGESFFVVIERPRGELIVEDKRAKPDENGATPKKTVYPQLPGRPRSDVSKQRRAVLVEWLTEPANPYLSRHLVNSVWERLLGERLVQNLDHWPPEAASTNSNLLNLLAEDFTRHNWEIKGLIQTIVLSDTYQRKSSSAEQGDAVVEASQREQQLTQWGRARIRALSADQLHQSLGQAFGYHFDENDHRLAEATGEEFTQDIPVNNLGSTSLTLGRTLALYNSDYIRGAVELGSEAAIRLYGPTVGSDHIERLFMSLLSRRPTTEELEFFQDLGGAADSREGIQDIVWVLLNSTEFVTNH